MTNGRNGKKSPLRILLRVWNGPEQSLGFFKYIVEVTYKYYWQVGSYTSSEQLKMKLGTGGIKINPIFDLGTFGGSNHPQK